MRKHGVMHGVPSPARHVAAQPPVRSPTASCSAAVTASSQLRRGPVVRLSHEPPSLSESVASTNRVT